MNLLGAFEEFFSETVYPHRYPVGIALLLLASATVLLAWRLRWHELLWQHRYLTAAIGAPVLLVMSFGGYYTLSPLWERSTLCEDNPLTRDIDESLFEGDDCSAPSLVATGGDTTATPTTTEVAPATSTEPATQTETPSPAVTSATPSVASTNTPAAFEPRVVSEGAWQGADDFHFARGRALLIETEPGRYTVRVEDFSVRNGPDLFVYLSPDPGGFADGALNLGELKATDGAFNYEVPVGTDISQFESVVVWCRQFAVLFGTASLQ